MQNNKQTVVAALHHLINKAEHDEKKIAAFFDPNYCQRVDGNELDYNRFIKHMDALKSHTAKMSITIKSIISEGDTVFTHHHVEVTNIQGGYSKFEVLARFTLSAGKITRCEELTRMISGPPCDRDMGSRS